MTVNLHYFKVTPRKWWWRLLPWKMDLVRAHEKFLNKLWQEDITQDDVFNVALLGTGRISDMDKGDPV